MFSLAHVRRPLLVGCLSLLTALVPASARSPSQHWYRGNLHAHSLHSDGAWVPEELVAWYRDHGYAFLALSDHDNIDDQESWRPLSLVQQRSGEAVLARLESRFGKSSVRLRGEGEGREFRITPYRELRERFDHPSSFLLLAGEEVTDAVEEHPVHLTAVNLTSRVTPQGGASIPEALARDLAKIAEQRVEPAQPVLGSLNHPNFAWAIDAAVIASTQQLAFIELLNGHPYTASRGDLARPSVERLWDRANAERILSHGWAPVFALAGDDVHDYPPGPGALPGRAWIVVRAAQLTAPCLLEAISRGDYYVSSGVTLSALDWNASARTLSLTAVPRSGEQLSIEIRGMRRTARARADASPEERWDVPEVGVLLARSRGSRLSYRLGPDVLFARAVVTSNQPPDNAPASSNYTGEQQAKAQAFTQPYGWREAVESAARAAR